MRNPKESWNLSDSYYEVAECETDYGCECDAARYCQYHIGPRDMKLAKTLLNAGPEHRKFLRQIFVSVDITAPMFWWSEFDTYKIGTVANSTSKMHKISSKPITIDNFETDDMNADIIVFNKEPYGYDETISDFADMMISGFESLRQRYLETGNKAYWKELIRWLPEGWLQTRTVTMNYENLLGMCSAGQRRFHKLNEWSGIDKDTCKNFIAWARTLPYANDFLFSDEKGE